MPKRRRTRALNRPSYIAAKRRQNQRVPLRNVEERLSIVANDEPPPSQVAQAGGVGGTGPDPITELARSAAAAGLQTATLDEVLCITEI